MKQNYFYNPILIKSNNAYWVNILKKDKGGNHVVTSVCRKTYDDVLNVAQKIVKKLNEKGSTGKCLRKLYK